MVYAGNDEVSPPATFEQMKRDFPRMSLHEVPDCGHAVPMEQPGLLADILLAAVPAASNEDQPPQAIPAE
jgi:pimeloyl-ACP methyl ester carboxylesterase